MAPHKAAAKKATKSAAPAKSEPGEEIVQPEASTSKPTPEVAVEEEVDGGEEEEAVVEDAGDEGEGEGDQAEEPTDAAHQARIDKMAQLRKRLTESAQANRRDLIQESNARAASGRQLARLERKKKQAEAMGEKQDARETGEDLERKRAWDYSIEDNENWDKKQEKKGRRADTGFADYDDSARRKYKRDMDVFKPDRQAYKAQRAAAEASSALIAGSSAHGAAADLYRDVHTFAYADHRPSEDAIDRVVGRLNVDLDKRQKRSRERKNEDDGDVTYINESNKHFNKKLERYLHAHTQDIRDNLERGTAL